MAIMGPMLKTTMDKFSLFIKCNILVEAYKYVYNDHKNVSLHK